MQPVVVVGGGIAGLSTAWYLSQAGAAVVVVEPQPQGQGSATHAAAGMLAPTHELEPTELPLLQLGLQARDLYPSLVAGLMATLGHDPGIHLQMHGTLEVALRPEDVPLVRRLYEWQQAQGLQVQWLEGAALQAAEPGLSPQVPAGILAPDDGQVEPRGLHRALSMALQAQGVTFYEDALAGLEAQSGGVTLHLTGGTVLLARQVVMATGAAALPPEVLRHVPPEHRPYPLRGQMLALTPPEVPLLGRPVRYRSRALGPGYLVPKPGRIIVGSTAEEMGHAPELTAGGVLDVLRKAYAACPAIYDLTIQETWAGLRPATPSRTPVCLALPTLPGVWWLNGLYRHGILLGPLMGKQAAERVADGAP